MNTNLGLDLLILHNKLLSHLLTGLQNLSTMGTIAVSILLDLKKAFDTVDHKILLKKLYAYGIRGIFLKWFESYLSGRTQYVVFDGVQSETHRVDCGVPQGSILGPLLFILNMNDICNVSKLMFTILLCWWYVRFTQGHRSIKINKTYQFRAEPSVHMV